MLSRRTITGSVTGVLYIPVWAVLPRHVTSAGIPTLTATRAPAPATASDARLTTIHLQRHTGHELVRQRKQHRLGHVVYRADACGRIGGAHVSEIVTLALVTERVPGPGIDDARRDGVHADR